MDILKAGEIIESALARAKMPFTQDQKIVFIGSLAVVLEYHKDDVCKEIIDRMINQQRLDRAAK